MSVLDVVYPKGRRWYINDMFLPCLLKFTKIRNCPRPLDWKPEISMWLVTFWSQGPIESTVLSSPDISRYVQMRVFNDSRMTRLTANFGFVVCLKTMEPIFSLINHHVFPQPVVFLSHFQTLTLTQICRYIYIYIIYNTYNVRPPFDS